MFEAIIGALLGGGLAIYQGEKERKAQSAALRQQQAAQRTSMLATIADSQRAAQAERKANKRRPDMMSILAREQQAAKAGQGASILAGRGGAAGGLLGSKSMLMG